MRKSNITNYKDIIRLHSSGDYSNRELAKILGVSRNTISACLEKKQRKRDDDSTAKGNVERRNLRPGKTKKIIKKVDPPRHTDTYYDTDITGCPDNTYNTDITD